MAHNGFGDISDGKSPAKDELTLHAESFDQLISEDDVRERQRAQFLTAMQSLKRDGDEMPSISEVGIQ